jgi:hypothetical protein
MASDEQTIPSAGRDETTKSIKHKGRSDEKRGGDEIKEVRKWKNEIKQRRVGIAAQTTRREPQSAQIVADGNVTKTMQLISWSPRCDMLTRGRSIQN